VKEAEEIRGATLVPRDEAALVLEPRKQPLDSPSAAVATEGSAVAGRLDAVATMGRDELDRAGGQRPVEGVAVVGRVADQARRVVGQKAGVQGLFDERDFVR
jgi:hypothetical protein